MYSENESHNPHDPNDPLTEPTSIGSNGSSSRLGPEHPVRIGQFTLRRVIASGGMGTVYEAIQENPRRSVAVKVVKRVIADDSMVHRLEYEAQILARLRHPGIAQIYEAGSYRIDNDQLPYFAMEYIPNARSITDYAREKKLSTAQRLDLILQVCDAVHHGHQRGIVHRDLKPSNILVDSHGRVRIIDFGIAHAADAESVRPDTESETGRIIGSLPYMSPEQFEYDPCDIDTRADIYALGVVSYELLAGSLPYDVFGKSIHEVARMVRETPPRSMRDHTESITDELEIIVNKALQKDRQQRYQSTFGIAQDIRRFLAGDAIVAKPPSLVYQIRVVARRNKLLTGSIAALFVLLVVGITITTTLWLQVDAERQRAEAESARVETARHFLAEVISSTAPVGYFDRVSIADVLDRASPKVSEVLSDDPLAEADVRHSLGLGYFRIARNMQAEEHLLRALAIYKQELGTEHDRTLKVLVDIAFLYSVTGENRKRLDIVRQIAEARQLRFGPFDPRTLAAKLTVANNQAAMNDMTEAIDLTRRTMEICQQTLGMENRLTFEAQLQYAWLLVEQERFVEAEQLARQGLQRAQVSFGDSDNLTKGARSVLAAALISQGRVKECHDLYDNKPLPTNLGIEYEYQGVPAIDRGWDLLLFWETWCPFSERAMPYYEKIYQQYRDAGLDILGLTECRAGSSDEEVRRFISEKNLSFTIARENGRPANYYACDGVPAIRLLHDGELIWESNDYSSRYVPRSMLEGLIAAK